MAAPMFFGRPSFGAQTFDLAVASLAAIFIELRCDSAPVVGPSRGSTPALRVHRSLDLPQPLG
jgi:hypothetical protein